MDFISLEYFCKAAELQHITNAAQALRITQPTLSAAIRRLELELGVRLFEQEGRNVRLTQEGRILQKHAVKILAEAAATQEEFSRMRDISDNRVVMICPPHVLGVEIMRKIHAQNPNITISIKGLYDLQTQTELKNGRVDLYVSHPPYIDAQFKSMRLAADPLMALMFTTHPLATKETLHIEDLSGETFIGYPPSLLRDEMESVCLRAGFSPNIACEIGNARDMLPLLASGTMIAIVPIGSCQALKHPHLLIRPICGIAIDACLGISWSKDRSLRAAVRIVRDTMLAGYAEDPNRLLQILPQDLQPAEEAALHPSDP